MITNVKVGAADKPLTREEALEVAERCAELLKRQYGATRVIVFGSARGDAPWHEGSDLDLAVEGIEDLFKAYGAVENEMPKNLAVDLVEIETAEPEMRARILGETTVPDDPVLALESLLADKLASAERLVRKSQAILNSTDPRSEPFKADAMAWCLHHLYTRIENIFKPIAVRIDGGLRKDEGWSARLLNDMNSARVGVRPAVIDTALCQQLAEYLDIRERVRYDYKHEWTWEELLPYAVRTRETLERLRAQLDQFFRALEAAKRNDED